MRRFRTYPTGKKGRALPYDSVVEYITCTKDGSNTPYIDTGFTPTSSCGFEIDSELISDSSDSYSIAGVESAWCNKSMVVWRWNGGCFSLFGSQSNNLVNYVSGTGRYRISVKGNKAYVDDALKYTFSEETFTCTGTLTIFGWRRTSTSTIECLSGANIKLYGFKIWDEDGTLVQDLIPVRVGTEGKLYNKIDGTIFGPYGGIGSFGVGDDVELPYDAEVEYLQTDGTAYVQVMFDNSFLLKNTDANISVTCSVGSGSTIGRIVSTLSNPGGFSISRSIASQAYKISYNQRLATATILANDDYTDGDYLNICLYNLGSTISTVVTYNGTDYTSTKNATTTSTVNITGFTIFCFKGTNGVASAFCPDAKVSSIMVDCVSGGTKVDLIPVRVGSTGYFYDKISGTLIGNSADGGAFILGPDK